MLLSLLKVTGSHFYPYFKTIYIVNWQKNTNKSFGISYGFPSTLPTVNFLEHMQLTNIER